MKVLITGHMGEVGRVILPRFAEDEVVGYDIREGDDLFDTARLMRMMRGCGAVVHLAAFGHRNAARTWEEFQHLNVEGTKRVFEAAKGAGVGRFVYCSSGNVYCQEPGDAWRGALKFPIGVSAVPDPDDSRLPHYPRSKLIAERWLQGEVRRTDAPEVIVLRPSWLGDVCPDGAWKGAHIKHATLAEGIYQACRVPLPRRFLILDLLERNANYRSVKETWSLLRLKPTLP